MPDVELSIYAFQMVSLDARWITHDVTLLSAAGYRAWQIYSQGLSVLIELFDGFQIMIGLHKFAFRVLVLGDYKSGHDM